MLVFLRGIERRYRERSLLPSSEQSSHTEFEAEIYVLKKEEGGTT